MEPEGLKQFKKPDKGTSGESTYIRIRPIAIYKASLF